MDQILRGQPGWEEAIASALAHAAHPIAVDPRFTPHVRSVSTTTGPRPATSVKPRHASTLLLVHPGVDGNLVVPLTLRHAGMRTHAGEVSLPGGSVEPIDTSREATALREAWEEIGVDPTSVHVAGALDDIWIPVSNFELRPFVATMTIRPDLHPQTDEVAAILELPLRYLLTDEIVAEEQFSGPGWRLRAAAYRYAGQRIWGATARALAMFATVLTDADASAHRLSYDD
jgi:8-oxo-dGTP pyrophosphatase MutT (NUDIX family)